MAIFPFAGMNSAGYEGLMRILCFGPRFFRLTMAAAISTSVFGVSAELPQLATKPPRVFKTELRPNWFNDGKQFWYRNDLAGGTREFVLVDVAKGERKPAFDHGALAKLLGELLKRKISPEKLPVERLQFKDDGRLSVLGNKQGWEWKSGDASIRALASDEQNDGAANRQPRSRSRRLIERMPPSRRIKSPDEKWEAFIRNHNLWVRKRDDQSERQLTTNGSSAQTFHYDVTAERGISMGYDRRPEPDSVPDVFWSPDSKKLIALRTRTVPERLVYYVEASPKGSVQPKLQSYPYFKAGDKIPTQTPHLFDIESGREIPVGDELIQNPWRLSEFRWEKDSSRFTFLYNQRGHQVLRLLALASDTGKLTPLVEERSKTFVDYAYKKYLWFSADGGELIWMSERDGWNHLYLYEAKKGTVKHQITKGTWMVRRVEGIDSTKREIMFSAMGVHPGQDPYHEHLCRVSFDGSGFKILTEADGNHAWKLSTDRKHFVDTWSRVDQPPVHELRRTSDGTLVCKLDEADVGEWRKAGFRMPERFVAKGRDGKTDIYGIIQLPRKFDPGKKYPVIENIYAGPHGFFTPKAFRSDYSHREDLLASGFIVVQMDGMGTNWRGKKFHDVCWKNIGDAGFPDRIAWIKAAAKERPYMDLTRVGIYGGSAGGQNAMRALIGHHDFYSVAIADCGCHDNRIDKIWWNEAWMGWPVGKEYEASSNVAQAHRLQGNLLLFLGGEDRNVDPASTFQVVDALVKANKEFDFILLPSSGHGSAESTYGKRRRLQFFQRHLQGTP